MRWESGLYLYAGVQGSVEQGNVLMPEKGISW